MDIAKLKEILAGLMTVHTCGNDSITQSQCMMQLDQYIKKQEVAPKSEGESKSKK